MRFLAILLALALSAPLCADPGALLLPALIELSRDVQEKPFASLEAKRARELVHCYVSETGSTDPILKHYVLEDYKNWGRLTLVTLMQYATPGTLALLFGPARVVKSRKLEAVDRWIAEGRLRNAVVNLIEPTLWNRLFQREAYARAQKNFEEAAHAFTDIHLGTEHKDLGPVRTRQRLQEVVWWAENQNAGCARKLALLSGTLRLY